MPVVALRSASEAGTFRAMRKALEQRRTGILTYGITPPKKSYDELKRREIAAKQADRIAALPIDGLVVYDIQDESTRTREERPFPYLECIDPVVYAYDYLQPVSCPKIVYQCVGGHDQASLTKQLSQIDEHHDVSVLVGAASRDQPTRLRLQEAYALRRRAFAGLPTGGVMIAERHEHVRDEETRIIRKMDSGCSFFISQAVYSVVASKNVLSDLHYSCEEQARALPPVLITLTPCGSRKTLEFMRWLGVSVPRWLENELLHAKDILETSVELCTEVFADLLTFAQQRQIPLGCNVESVSLRKAEIDASVELTHRVAALLSR